MQFYTLRIFSQFLLVFRRIQFNELIMFGILVRQVNDLNQAKHINLMNLISRSYENVWIWPAIFLSQKTKNCRFKKFLYQTSEYFCLNGEKVILQSVKTQLHLKRNHLHSAKFRFCNSQAAPFRNTQNLKFLLLLLKNWSCLLWKAEFTLEYLLGSPFKPKESFERIPHSFSYKRENMQFILLIESPQ